MAVSIDDGSPIADNGDCSTTSWTRSP